MNRFAPLLRAGLLAAAALSTSLASQAQTPSDYPTKPIKLIVPYPPGGGTDVIARVVQERFQALLGQPVVIENKGGAAGSIGTETAAKAAPDGYTVLFTLSSHTINPSIYPKLPFDTAKDFEPVGMVASLPQILVANMQFAPNTVAEVVALAKAKPGTLSFASVGNGSPGHLAGELLKLRSGTQMTHIPYRGGGPAVTDVMGGQVPLLWVSIPAAAQFVKAGKLKALAVSTTKRSAAFPEVPTMQEAGIADFDVDSWYAMFVPAKTPKSAIDKLNKVINTVVREPEIRDKLLAQGSEGVGGPPEALGKIVDTELVRWAKLAKEASIKVD
ncbi:tripartite tricarboxylate transporter substrate binding protein [Variovorax guangxiensis]|uniref:Tripartite tricarboxylate transporter substrate binding protein n=1 Tax=Variovorax guangxiensis TaxID=1775474 RepID=A0A502DZS2_9BURK|nr:tripartite tricarboxylate transporter substrate binding protein [Variovorax guangxiensis]RZI69197.1 MAG: tripartite tricarboxylate transporter substrate binding protein [Variovorax sp.]TPG26434.1 tripartite tricarboxylate transporter substrate binding protein [Variovorax ginsengisoli]TPG30159.1 tripartite tricarboxylate transporter substrate binding protein [Variovorax guangxiensis]